MSSAASLRSVARQDGSRPITGTPDSTYGASVGHRARHDPLRLVELAGGDPGEPAAGVVGDHAGGQPGRLEVADRGVAVGREEVVAEGVRPDPDVRGSAVEGVALGDRLPQRLPARTPGSNGAGRCRPSPWPASPPGRAASSGWPAARPARPDPPSAGAGRAGGGCAGGVRPATSCFWCSASALYVAMSTPVGQSDAQPLQARQRSSASATAGSANPCTSEPSIASWSTRERPRVESFSSRVAR